MCARARASVSLLFLFKINVSHNNVAVAGYLTGIQSGVSPFPRVPSVIASAHSLFVTFIPSAHSLLPAAYSIVSLSDDIYFSDCSTRVKTIIRNNTYIRWAKTLCENEIMLFTL